VCQGYSHSAWSGVISIILFVVDQSALFCQPPFHDSFGTNHGKTVLRLLVGSVEHECGWSCPSHNKGMWGSREGHQARHISAVANASAQSMGAFQNTLLLAGVDHHIGDFDS